MKNDYITRRFPFKPSFLSFQIVQKISIKELYFLPLNFLLFFKQIRFNKI
jgi:hypothetical protein